MKIPTFVVDDDTERLFRNLIAYELYEEGSTYVIDYVTLMDNLINSSKDVQLLRFSDIIENMLGDDEAVAKMLNKLRDHVILCVPGHSSPLLLLFSLSFLPSDSL
ncbi:Protein of unknown function DUF247 [Theobroma cacao]|nr:Protein of unknown function DUF247 [Theobroma cacao]